MKKLTRQEKHEQCMREIRGTLIVVLICCAWHIASAFLLNGTGLYFLGMPAWFSVSTFGTYQKICRGNAQRVFGL